MNIVLVPYNWTRHVVVALGVGTAALLAWWSYLMTAAVIAPALGLIWMRWVEGILLLSLASAVIAATSVGIEGALRRQPILLRIGLPLGALLIAFLCTGIGSGTFQFLHRVLATKDFAEIVADPSYTSLRHKLLMWATAGLASGIAPLAVRVGMTRKLSGAFEHVAGGLAAGLLGAAVWHTLGHYGLKIPTFIDPSGRYLVAPDLYLASALGLFTWGIVHGLFVWGVPNELYAGWIRILSPHRFGHRIPVDKPVGGPSERFVGHFPRGLDVFIPADKGVAELHASFFTDGSNNYTVRGLSQHPTLVKRPLEKVDLRYDPRRPAPLETDLHSEDRIFVSMGNAQTEVEFILLPKEEN